MIRKLWNKMNGKKTFTGIGLTLAGCIMFNVPFLEPAAPYFISSGLACFGIGASHKIIKNKEVKK